MFYVCNCSAKEEWVDILDTSDDVIERCSFKKAQEYINLGARVIGYGKVNGWFARVPKMRVYSISVKKPMAVLKEIVVSENSSVENKYVSGVFILTSEADLTTLESCIKSAGLVLVDYDTVSEIEIKGYPVVVRISLAFEDILNLRSYVETHWDVILRIICRSDDGRPYISTLFNLEKIITEENCDGGENDSYLMSRNYGQNTLWDYYKVFLQFGCVYNGVG